MALGVALIVGLALRVMTGRSVEGIGEIRIRGDYLLAVALVSIGVTPALTEALHAGRVLQLAIWFSAMALTFVLCLINWRIRGITALAAGVALNLVVIVANRGMPVLPAAIQAAGGPTGRLASDISHVLSVSAPALPVVADAIPVPGIRGLRSVLSVGDVLMLAGAAIVLVAAPVAPGRERRCSLTGFFRESGG